MLRLALKGKLFQQFAEEIRELREKGKIADNFAERKYGYQTWVELLAVIDEETPDEDRLEALKAMFYAANKVSATDGQQIFAYQLLQIAKRLKSNELTVLKAVYELYTKRQTDLGSGGYREWALKVASYLGHSVTGLIDRADSILLEDCLLSSRLQNSISLTYFRLTDLGLEFCQNIEH